jgi:hypothetical protein
VNLTHLQICRPTFDRSPAPGAPAPRPAFIDFRYDPWKPQVHPQEPPGVLVWVDPLAFCAVSPPLFCSTLSLLPATSLRLQRPRLAEYYSKSVHPHPILTPFPHPFEGSVRDCTTLETPLLLCLSLESAAQGTQSRPR